MMLKKQMRPDPDTTNPLSIIIKRQKINSKEIFLDKEYYSMQSKATLRKGIPLYKVYGKMPISIFPNILLDNIGR